jgi:hypothetical protein
MGVTVQRSRGSLQALDGLSRGVQRLPKGAELAAVDQPLRLVEDRVECRKRPPEAVESLVQRSELPARLSRRRALGPRIHEPPEAEHKAVLAMGPGRQLVHGRHHRRAAGGQPASHLHIASQPCPGAVGAHRRRGGCYPRHHRQRGKVHQHVAEIAHNSRIGHLEAVAARHRHRRTHGALAQSARQICTSQR